MYFTENMRFVMDDTSTPYKDGEVPFTRTAADEEFEKKICEKYHLVTKEMEEDRRIGFARIVET